MTDYRPSPEQWGKIATKLAEPFDPRNVKFRPGHTVGDRVVALAYIDARAVMARLDETVGIDGWTFQYEPIAMQGDVMRLAKGTLTIHGIYKQDIGDASNIDPSKGCVSDAFKRAAVMWGIGRYLYDHPTGLVYLGKDKRISPNDIERLRANLPTPGDPFVDADEQQTDDVVDTGTNGLEQVTKRGTMTRRASAPSVASEPDTSSTVPDASTAPSAPPNSEDDVVDVAPPMRARTEAERSEMNAANRALGTTLGLIDPTAKIPNERYVKEYYRWRRMPYKAGMQAPILSDREQDEWRGHLMDLLEVKQAKEKPASVEPSFGTPDLATVKGLGGRPN